MNIEDQIQELRQCVIDLQDLSNRLNDEDLWTSIKIGDISKRIQHALDGEYQD